MLSCSRLLTLSVSPAASCARAGGVGAGGNVKEMLVKSPSYERLKSMVGGEADLVATSEQQEQAAAAAVAQQIEEAGGEGPSSEELTNFIRSRQLDSLANGYLEQLRAEARIVELR